MMYRLRQFALKYSTSLMPLMGLFVANYWSQRSLNKSKFVPNIQFKQHFGLKSAHLWSDCKQWLQGLDERSFNSIWNEIPDYVVIVGLVANKTIGPRGTGVVVSDDGLIVTNCHVVMDRQTVVIQFCKQLNMDTIYESVRSNKPIESIYARVIYREPWMDLALIRMPRVKPLALGRCHWIYDTTLGEPVLSVGSAAIKWSIASGYIISTNHYENNIFKTKLDSLNIKHSCPISHGFSGGPLFNASSQVIGINFACHKHGIPYAIRMIDVIAFMQRGIEFETNDNRDQFTRTKGLGVSLKLINRRLQVAKNIFYLFPDDLSLNDILTQVNGVDLVSFSQLLDAINQLSEDNRQLVIFKYNSMFDETLQIKDFDFVCHIF